MLKLCQRGFYRTLVTFETIEAWCTVAGPRHWMAELVCLRALTDLVAVLPKCSRKTSWGRPTQVSLRSSVAALRVQTELADRLVSLTLFTAVASESRRTATLSGHVVAGRALSTAASPRAALTVRTRQTCCKPRRTMKAQLYCRTLTVGKY